MQLTRAADYAVRVMIHLASQPEAAVVSKTLLARAAEAPESFLSKILQALTRAGLIQARRGVVGGFLLLPKGAHASILDVVEAIDGPIALNVCLTSGGYCQRQPECSAHNVWLKAQSAMLLVLGEAKIAEMIPKQELSRLQDIATSGVSGRHESNEIISQFETLEGPGTTARPSVAPKGARRIKKNKL